MLDDGDKQKARLLARFKPMAAQTIRRAYRRRK
jgi:endoglucanase